MTAVLIGSDVKDLADELAKYGADHVIVVDDPKLKDYRTEPYAQALAGVINEYKPEIVLVGATAIGRDLGPTVSARVKTGLTADCTSLEIGQFPLNADPADAKQNQLLMTRPAFGGNTIATIACPDNRPQMATVRPGVMIKRDPDASAKADIIEYKGDITENNKYVEILDIVKNVAKTVDIMDAKILVSGGRGVGSPENFKMLEDLADALGGTVSCSRAVVDNGWKPKDLPGRYSKRQKYFYFCSFTAPDLRCKATYSTANPCASCRRLYSERQNIFVFHYKYKKLVVFKKGRSGQSHKDFERRCRLIHLKKCKKRCLSALLPAICFCRS